MAQAIRENQAPLADDEPPQHRYLAGRLSHASTFKPKTFSWSPAKMSKLPYLTQPELYPQRSALLRPHQARYLAQKLARCQYGDASPRRRRHRRRGLAPLVEEREGRDLAAGGLEYEEREAERQILLEAQLGEGAHDCVGDEETARLYRLGLLYDDEHERGSGFTLGAIMHDDAPAYTLDVREARRRGKRERPVSSPAFSHADTADDEALAVSLAEADYVDVHGDDLAEAVRLQRRLWAAFRGGHASVVDEGEWEVV